MSAKTKAYSQVQINAFEVQLRARDKEVTDWETIVRESSSRSPGYPLVKAGLEAATVARDAVARRLSKMQEARGERT